MKDRFEHGNFVEQFGLHAQRNENGDPTVKVDVERYADLLDDPSLDADKKEEIIHALWTIIVTFVELGFGVSPTQQACGKLEKKLDPACEVDSDENDIEGAELKEKFNDGPRVPEAFEPQEGKE